MKYCTTDYSIFKKHPKNREINKLNLNKIKSSLFANNLLKLRPITVDEQMRVVDGQHRLESAKSLNLEVYYEIDEEVKDDDILTLNVNQKVWLMNDYLNYFVECGKNDYIKFHNFMKDSGMTINNVLRVVYSNGRKISEQFKKGELKFDETAIASLRGKTNLLRQVVTLLEEKIPKCPFVRTTTFQRAFFILLEADGFHFETFLKKLVFKMGLLRPCTCVKDYLDIFVEIYNWKNSNVISLSR